MTYLADLDPQVHDEWLSHSFRCFCGFIGTLEDCCHVNGSYLCPECGREDEWTDEAPDFCDECGGLDYGHAGWCSARGL